MKSTFCILFVSQQENQYGLKESATYNINSEITEIFLKQIFCQKSKFPFIRISATLQQLF